MGINYTLLAKSGNEKKAATGDNSPIILGLDALKSLSGAKYVKVELASIPVQFLASPIKDGEKRVVRVEFKAFGSGVFAASAPKKYVDAYPVLGAPFNVQFEVVPIFEPGYGPDAGNREVGKLTLEVVEQPRLFKFKDDKGEPLDDWDDLGRYLSSGKAVMLRMVAKPRFVAFNGRKAVKYRTVGGLDSMRTVQFAELMLGTYKEG